MSIQIEVDQISKQYRIGVVGTGTITHDLNRFYCKLLGKEDPYTEIGEVNNRALKGQSDYVWAIKDLSFKVSQGEVLGIIGNNGAGKSTLLKILSQITKPTLGRVRMKGKVGSLLEVGTGFHPDLTGRENVYINGAILGMRKYEITEKLDEIISFAGVERYIDTPVKRYSSGMLVRLGFSVAAHLEPEILIIDEVLAVGDVEFQKKCLGKMGEVSREKGRTILFVSHNLGAISTLCSKVVVLDQGRMAFQGSTAEGLTKYFDLRNDSLGLSLDNHRPFKNLKRIVSFENLKFEKGNVFRSNDEIGFLISLVSKENKKNLRFSFTISNSLNGAVGSAFAENKIDVSSNCANFFRVCFLNPNLSAGTYYFTLSVGQGDNNEITEDYDIVTDVLEFEIQPGITSFGALSRWDSNWGNIHIKGIKLCEVQDFRS